MNYIKKLFTRKPTMLINTAALKRYCDAEWGPNSNFVYSQMLEGKSIDEIRRLV